MFRGTLGKVSANIDYLAGSDVREKRTGTSSKLLGKVRAEFGNEPNDRLYEFHTLEVVNVGKSFIKMERPAVIACEVVRGRYCPVTSASPCPDSFPTSNHKP